MNSLNMYVLCLHQICDVFSHYFFKNFFCLVLSLFFLWDSWWWCMFDAIAHVSLTVFILIYLFPLLLRLNNFNVCLSSRMLILSSTFSYLLMNSLSEFFLFQLLYFVVPVFFVWVLLKIICISSLLIPFYSYIIFQIFLSSLPMVFL